MPRTVSPFKRILLPKVIALAPNALPLLHSDHGRGDS